MEPTTSTSNKASWATQAKCIIYGYCMFLTTFSLIKTTGVFFIHLQNDFGASAAQASFTISLPSAVVFMGGPAYGAVFNSAGIKPTFALAGILMFIGFGSCFFASNLFFTQIFMCIAGIGAGLSNVATLTLLGRAFYTSRPVALGALAMGGATAVAVGGPALQLCIDSYTWRGALLILGAYCLHGVVIGLALEPVYLEIVRKRETALILRVLKSPARERNYEIEEDSCSNDRSSRSSTDEVFGEENIVFEEQQRTSTPFVSPRTRRLQRRKSSVYDRFAALGTNFASVFDVSLLKNPWFVCYCLSCGFSISSRILSGLYLVRYAQAFGINDQDAAMKLTVCEGISFAMTPVIGFLTSVKRKTSRREENKFLQWIRRIISSIRRSYLLGSFQILMAIVIAFSTIITHNEGFVAYAAMLGFCYGGVTSMTNVVLADMFGTKQLAGAFGYRSLASGIMFLGIPPSIGYFIDMTGTYKVAQYFTGTMTLLAGILTILSQAMILRNERLLDRNNNKNDDVVVT
uniref:monocarboxylate transporter 2-like isoform X1 n=2 Tax=Styela clava TaxID=7725 RepID=UPI001939F7A9|nr:monocarboxylate transporter 2-like isoform X1 [Styela clava]